MYFFDEASLHLKCLTELLLNSEWEDEEKNKENALKCTQKNFFTYGSWVNNFSFERCLWYFF